MKSGTTVTRANYLKVQVIDWNKGVCPNTFLGRYLVCGEPGYRHSVSRTLDKSFFRGWSVIDGPAFDESVPLWAQFTVPGDESSMLNTWNEGERCYMDTGKVIYNTELKSKEDFETSVKAAFPQYDIKFVYCSDFQSKASA